MLVFSGSDAYGNLKKNIGLGQVRIPMKQEVQFYRDGGIFPRINPKFHLHSGDKIFTIGSCFARHIEAVLVELGFDVPVSRFTLPGLEIGHPAPHILNEYNAGTMFQRLESVAGLFSYEPEMGIEENANGFIDLFLHVDTLPVSYDRLIERRLEIDRLYREMVSSHAVVLTMGLVEAWFDTKFGCYLNKAPSKAMVRGSEGRFELHRFDVEDVVERMSRSIEIIVGLGAKNILLTVSPVPLEATFMLEGSVQANSYSKSVLRVAADILTRRHSFVDYYPSYEIVTSFGTSGFGNCNVHVLEGLIEKVTRYMAENYVAAAEVDVSSVA